MRSIRQPVRIARHAAAIVIVLLAGLAGEIAVACPNCKEALGDDKMRGLSEGLNASILGMISMPFLLFGAVAGFLYLSYRRRRGMADVRQPGGMN